MVKRVVVSWADRHLIPDWRHAHRLWSVRAEIAFGLAGILVTLLTLVSDRAQETFGTWRFAAAFAAASLVKLGLRLWKQFATGKDVEDDG